MFSRATAPGGGSSRPGTDLLVNNSARDDLFTPDAWRFQLVNATPLLLVGVDSSWSRASAGVAQSRVMRGRRLSSSATLARIPGPWKDRSVPLGKYWRSSPLVFSLEPRCQGEWGSQK